MKTWLFPFCVALLAVSLVPSGGAAADHEAVRRAVMAGRYKPLVDILEMVQKKYPGRVLDVELEREPGGRHVYEVKLLDDRNRRQELHIDAVTGKEVDVLPKRQAMPLSAMLRKVLKRYPGRVIDVDLKDNVVGQQSLYQVRVLQEDGEIRSVFLDAEKGEMVSDIEHVKPTAAMMSLPDLLDRLDRSHPGAVLEAELKYDLNQRPFYEVDLLLSDGRLTEIWVDSITGRVLSEDEMEIR
ncbi:MAG: PepSY domain-containing protein [Lautropia sp.]|nr:PepSY domain-containing protein [Lautropia sp.]